MLARLSSQETLGLVSVALALAVLLVCILDVDFLVHEKLLVHVFYRLVGSFKGVIGDEAESFGDACIVSRNLELSTPACRKKEEEKKTYLGSGNQVSKSAEGVVQSLFVHHAIQIAHKQFCAHLDGLLLICRCLTPVSPQIHPDEHQIAPC